jgi:hypothetical protein
VVMGADKAASTLPRNGFALVAGEISLRGDK